MRSRMAGSRRQCTALRPCGLASPWSPGCPSAVTAYSPPHNPQLLPRLSPALDRRSPPGPTLLITSTACVEACTDLPHSSFPGHPLLLGQVLKRLPGHPRSHSLKARRGGCLVGVVG